MQYGCIGEHLPHSFSKLIHGKIGHYGYDLQELTPDEVGPFLERRAFCAINVTIPYKETVIPYLDEISPSARAIGAVNTIVNRGGRLCGYNTDYIGMSRLARKIGMDFADKTVLILGTGGTGKTACAVARDGGAKTVLCVSRTARDGAITYEEAYARHRDAQIVINTTPCGMYPNTEGPAALDLAPFPALCGVLDAVYNPLRTNLILQAEQLGIPAAGGLYMLVAQAVAASEIFLDCRYPDELTDSIFLDMVKDKRNLVLIGMPSAGKTTVGRLLAARTGRVFLDSDEEIFRETGLTPAAIIAARGIAAFRDVERAVIGQLAARTGVILATGGGTVLDARNVSALKKNGLLVWLDRPLERLQPTADRPLSDSSEKLNALYAARAPLYRAAADLRLAADGTPEDAVQILERQDLL